MPRKDETKGAAGQVAWQEDVLKKRNRISRLEREIERGRDDDMDITKISFRMPRWDGDEYMVIVKAQLNGQQLVAFHSGDGLFDTLAGLAGRLANKSMKFREDEPYGS